MPETMAPFRLESHKNATGLSRARLDALSEAKVEAALLAIEAEERAELAEAEEQAQTEEMAEERAEADSIRVEVPVRVRVTVGLGLG